MAVKRALPKPFQRPGIEISEAKKVWREAVPSELSEGDMIRDYGKIEAISRERATICLLFLSGKTIYLTDDTQVVAFTQAT